MKVYFPGGKRVYADYKGFTIQTDQSKLSGGEESAPAPFDLFLASIGTCVGIYVLSFCEMRGIPTDDITISLSFNRNKEKGLIDKIDIMINLPEDFPEKYKNAVILSAEQCAVKKHLKNPPEFEIKTT